MKDSSPRWPHDRYTERLRLWPEDWRPRLRLLDDEALRLQQRIEELLRSPAGPSEEGPRMLVVEDDPTTRDALRGIFTLKGWEVVAAGTVADGLVGLEPPPDCVILDLMLPDGDGLAILEAARSSGRATRVVVTTGVEDPARLVALATLAPDAVLYKPIVLEALCEACLGPV
jgi:CheY-like chemotaxis protein